MSARFLTAVFKRRPAPKQYDPTFFNVEIARIQKSVPSFVIRSVTASTILSVNDAMLVCDATSTAITVTLMAPNLASGQPVTIKKSDASANAIIIGGTVDGVLNRTLANQNDSIIIQSDGSSWFRPTLTALGSPTDYSTSVFTVGALVANASTLTGANLLTSPKDIGVSPWVLSDVTVISNDTTAPDGTLTADRLSDAGVFGVGAVYQPMTGGSGLVTLSVSLKFISSIANDIGIYDATAAAWITRATVNWVAGVATSVTYPAGGGATFPIVDEGGGWYRIAFTTTGSWVAGRTIRAAVYPSWLGSAGGGEVHVWDVRCYTAVDAITAIGSVAITGAVTVTGAMSVSSTITASSLTASLPVFTNASKQLVSNAVTGSGNVVMSIAPTLTGTTTLDGLTLAPDKSMKVNLGRYSAGFPWSYLRLGSTSSGLRISNAADLLNVLELADTGYLSLLIAQATPSALSATQHYTFASTVSGATLMGYGTTGDVTLKGRSGNDALYVVANTLNTRAKGSLTSDAATGGVGYATGAGGTVTQGAGSGKATAFTLSKVCGQITTDAANLAADTTVSATWTNTAIAATDVVSISHVSGGTVGAYSFNVQPGAGTATLNITNISTGALAEALVLNFVVLKGVAA